MSFETSVFINCPFDEKYLPILKPLLFCNRQKYIDSLPIGELIACMQDWAEASDGRLRLR